MQGARAHCWQDATGTAHRPTWTLPAARFIAVREGLIGVGKAATKHCFEPRDRFQRRHNTLFLADPAFGATRGGRGRRRRIRGEAHGPAPGRQAQCGGWVREAAEPEEPAEGAPGGRRRRVCVGVQRRERRSEVLQRVAPAQADAPCTKTRYQVPQRCACAIDAPPAAGRAFRAHLACGAEGPLRGAPLACS